MLLKDIVKDIEIKIPASVNLDLEIKDVSADSREIGNEALFIAVKGLKHDGHDHIGEAADNGAIAIITERDVELPGKSPIQLVVKDTRKAIPVISKNFFNDPSDYLKLVGITGTNGKTTTAYLLRSILKSGGIKASMITTVESFIDDKKIDFSRTTPESIELNRFFRESLQNDVVVSIMEVSSHAIDRNRVDHLGFDCFAYTNLSQDHLDYHNSMEEYFLVKSRLFDPRFRTLYNGETAVINIDDDYGRRLKELTDLDILTYSLQDREADIFAYDIKNTISGIEIKTKVFKEEIDIASPLSGYFNIYNILAAIGIAYSLDIRAEKIKKGIKEMKGVNGRFEKVDTVKGIDVIVDYAHTPDGLKKVLENARSLVKPGGRLISVFGCGGDRDKGKREKMGSISADLADLTIITSDNPRSEDPESIIGMIEKGFKGREGKSYIVEQDREIAINTALGKARINDIVLIAGKGHEDYQEFIDRRIHFSDREIVEGWGRD